MSGNGGDVAHYYADYFYWDEILLCLDILSQAQCVFMQTNLGGGADL